MIGSNLFHGLNAAGFGVNGLIEGPKLIAICFYSLVLGRQLWYGRSRLYQAACSDTLEQSGVSYFVTTNCDLCQGLRTRHCTSSRLLSIMPAGCSAGGVSINASRYHQGLALHPHIDNHD